MWDEQHLAAVLTGQVANYAVELAALLDERHDLAVVDLERQAERRAWLQRRLAMDATVTAIYQGHGPARVVA